LEAPTLKWPATCSCTKRHDNLKLIWTKSNLPLSLLIRKGLDEPCSHFAVVFDDRIVFHSNLKGCHVEWYSTFKKHNTVVFEEERKLNLEQEELVYQSLIDANDGKSYDYLAFLYFMLMAVRRRLFGKPLPQTNSWQKKSSLLCTGLAAYLPSNLFPELSTIRDLEIISPYQLYLLMKKE